MRNAIKKSKFSAEEQVLFSAILASWRSFLNWLRACEDEDELFRCLIYEVQNEGRPAFIDRARTRFNKLRALRELKELEEYTGKIISVHYV